MMATRYGLFFLSWMTLSLAICEALGMRGAVNMNEQQEQQRQLMLSSNEGLNCSSELSLDIICQGDCNFTARPLTCESKMFLYHGGPCRGSLSVSRDISSDSAADCQDHNGGPPTDMDEEVFVVITDVQTPNLTSSQTVSRGDYFWTQYENIPTGMMGWSNTQNITFYSSNVTTYDNMLQTMLFYAPCIVTPLEALDQDQSVQLVGLALDPKIKAEFEVEIVSLTDRTWQLTSASVGLNVEPFFQELPVLDTTATFDQSTPLRIPLAIEMGRNDTLTILASATAITTDGVSQCSVNALATSPFV